MIMVVMLFQMQMGATFQTGGTIDADSKRQWDEGMDYTNVI